MVSCSQNDTPFIIFLASKMGWNRYVNVIVDLMEEEGIYWEQVTNRHANQGVRGYGHATCWCGNTWGSYHSYVIINLKKQRPVRVSLHHVSIRLLLSHSCNYSANMFKHNDGDDKTYYLHWFYGYAQINPKSALIFHFRFVIPVTVTTLLSYSIRRKINAFSDPLWCSICIQKVKFHNFMMSHDNHPS